MMYKLYIRPAEGISTTRTEDGICTKPASVAGTSVLPPVSNPTPSSLREGLGENQDQHVHEGCTCTHHSLTTHSHKHNTNQPTKKTATANATTDILVQGRSALKSFVEVGR